jgi:hypothetical protein
MTDTSDDFAARRDRAWELANAASERVPRAEDWGFFSSEPPPSGIGAFCWFDSRDQLLEFLAEHGPYMFATRDPGDWTGWSESVRQFRSVADRARRGEVSDGDVRSSARSSIDPSGQLDWVGAADELISGHSEFATRVRESLIDADEYPDLDGSDPVPPDAVDDFLGGLTEYGH